MAHLFARASSISWNIAFASLHDVSRSCLFSKLAQRITATLTQPAAMASTQCLFGDGSKTVSNKLGLLAGNDPIYATQKRFFQVRNPPQRLKLKCDDCYFALINGLKYTLCKRHKWHNQVQKKPSEWLKWIETTQYKALKKY